jgi:hypothetical protein
MAYSNRFQKNFEIGGELLAGLSEAVFPDLFAAMQSYYVDNPLLQSA